MISSEFIRKAHWFNPEFFSVISNTSTRRHPSRDQLHITDVKQGYDEAQTISHQLPRVINISSATLTAIVKMVESLPNELQEQVAEVIWDFIVELEDDARWN